MIADMQRQYYSVGVVVTRSQSRTGIGLRISNFLSYNLVPVIIALNHPGI